MAKQIDNPVLAQARSAIRDAEKARQKAQRACGRQRKLLASRQQAVAEAASVVKKAGDDVEEAKKGAYAALFIEYFETEEDLTVFFRCIYDQECALVFDVAKATGIPEPATKILLDGFCTEIGTPLDNSVFDRWTDGKQTYSLTYTGLNFLMRRDNRLFERAARDWAKNGGSEYGSHGRSTDNLTAGRIVQELGMRMPGKGVSNENK